MFRVPGAFALPVAAASAANAGWDGIVALGVIVRGQTSLFDHLSQVTAFGLTEVSVRTCVPIGFGVLTGDSMQHVLGRAGLSDSTDNKGL